MPTGLETVYETVRELCSESMRPHCDATFAPFRDAAAGTGGGGRRAPLPLGRAVRCTLRHRRDASIAVGLAAATPCSMQDTLDRSLIALLEASADYHRRRCSMPERSNGEREPCPR